MKRVSKSEFDLLVSRLKKQGQEKVIDKKIGNDRLIETDKVRMLFKSNGWLQVDHK